MKSTVLTKAISSERRYTAASSQVLKADEQVGVLRGTECLRRFRQIRRTDFRCSPAGAGETRERFLLE